MDLFERSSRFSLTETLVPMLDDVARAFGCDRGLIAVYDRARHTLRGTSGYGLAPALVDSFEIRMDDQPAAFQKALEAGEPMRVDDVVRDQRFSEPTKLLLIESGFQRIALVPVTGPESQPIGVVALSRRTPFTLAELRAISAVTNRAREVIVQARDAAEARDTSSAAAVEMEWMRSAINVVDDAVVVTDDQNEIVLRNTRAEVLFRVHDDDSEGRRHAVWMNNFLFTAALSSWKLEPAAPSAAREVTLVDPIEGAEIVFEVIARPAMNYRDGTLGTVSLLKDITQLRHVTEELVQGQEQLGTMVETIRVERDRLELILRNAPNPIVVLGPGEEPITMNPAARRLFGAEEQRTAPVSDRKRQIVLANETRFTSFVSQLRLEPGHGKAGELALTDPVTEAGLEMAVTAGEIRDDLGAVVGFVAVLQDIGGLRELERLQEQDELKSQFLSIASHELRTPITSVSGFAQLALRRLRARLDEAPPAEPAWAAEMERLLRQLGVIFEQSTRLGRLVRELLDVSRIQAGRLAFELQPVDLGELARSVVEQMEMVAGDHPLVVNVHETPVVIEGDRDHLEQVLANLVDNAIKYSPAGRPIQIRVSEQAGEARCDVLDDGIGIARSQLDHVFELFFRSGGDDSSRTPGLGLGLYIAREIVERHGGRIWLESEIGEGTAVHVALPVWSGDATEPARPAASAEKVRL
ncbi:MAG: GAF domain-containing protein [Chloroflexi bacterium]|nr:GAF domain-containing protein [Chloroflexota bacterium]